MRLIEIYAGRACFKISIAFAMLGKWFAGIVIAHEIKARRLTTGVFLLVQWTAAEGARAQ
jgi:hypothetical protein